MSVNRTIKRRRTSKIWLLPDNEFIHLIAKSNRMKDVLGFFGVANKGGNFNTANARIEHLGLSKAHMMSSYESTHFSRNLSIDEFLNDWLVVNSQRSRKAIKDNILKFKILPWVCSECGNNGSWCNKKLVLHLEHKNGVSNDHRIKNLCFLCPNCHSQTKTYAGKNCRTRT